MAFSKLFKSFRKSNKNQNDSQNINNQNNTSIEFDDLSESNDKIKTTTVNDLQNKRKAILRNYGIGIIFLAILVVVVMAAASLFDSFREKATRRADIKQKDQVLLNIYGNEDTWKIQVNNRIMGINRKLDQKFYEIREATKQDAKDARRLIDTSLGMMTEQIDKSIKRLNWLVEDVKDDFKKITDETKDELLEARNDIKTARESINTTEERLKKYTAEQVQKSLLGLEQKLLEQINLNRDGIKNSKITFLGNPTNIPSTRLLPPGEIDTSLPSLLQPASVFFTTKEDKKDSVQTREEVLDYSKEDSYRFVNITDIDVDNSVDYASIYDSQNRKKTEKKPGLHIMTGFANALLITGVAAPTFGKGLKNPKPVILTVESDLIIANDDTEDMKNCMLLGTATGNMNSSRAEIQITRLSCSITQRDGKKFKIEQSGSPLGWIIGEDGKYGLKGRLVDSSSKVIMRELMIGFLQGVADSFSNKSDANSGTADIALGASSGAGEGAGKAFDNLAEYYQKMLDGMYPVVDIKAGRKVTVLFKGSQGVSESSYRSLEIQERRNDGEYNRVENSEEIEIGYQNW